MNEPDDTLKIACAELAGYRDGFEGLPQNPTFTSSDENLGYLLWFGKARKERSNLIEQTDTLDRLLKEARAQLATLIAERAAVLELLRQVKVGAENGTAGLELEQAIELFGTTS